MTFLYIHSYSVPFEVRTFKNVRRRVGVIICPNSQTVLLKSHLLLKNHAFKLLIVLKPINRNIKKFKSHVTVRRTQGRSVTACKSIEKLSESDFGFQAVTLLILHCYMSPRGMLHCRVCMSIHTLKMTKFALDYVMLFLECGSEPQLTFFFSDLIFKRKIEK